MDVILNGKPSQVPERATVQQLLSEKGLIPARVAIEINEELVSRKEFGIVLIQPGDRIEIVTLVGGG